MYLTTPQILSLYSLAMDFTRDARFEIINQSTSGDIIVKVINAYGERGFGISASGGGAEDIRAMNRATSTLTALVGAPTALENGRALADTDDPGI